MPLIWGEMGREIFLSKGLDRANHVELVQKNRAAAHPYVIDNLRHHGHCRAMDTSAAPASDRKKMLLHCSLH